VTNEEKDVGAGELNNTMTVGVPELNGDLIAAVTISSSSKDTTADGGLRDEYNGSLPMTVNRQVPSNLDRLSLDSSCPCRLRGSFVELCPR
jgi:hypothetical protein